LSPCPRAKRRWLIAHAFYAIELPNATKLINEGDVVEVDLDAGKVINKTQDKSYEIAVFPEFMQEIYAAGRFAGLHQKQNVTVAICCPRYCSEKALYYLGPAFIIIKGSGKK
jgi:hypothetical protein